MPATEGHLIAPLLFATTRAGFEMGCLAVEVEHVSLQCTSSGITSGMVNTTHEMFIYRAVVADGLQACLRMSAVFIQSWRVHSER